MFGMLDKMMSLGCTVGAAIGAFMLWSTIMGGEWLSDQGNALPSWKRFGMQLFLFAAVAFFVHATRWYWRNSGQR
jgi:hypothetical protein